MIRSTLLPMCRNQRMHFAPYTRPEGTATPIAIQMTIMAHPASHDSTHASPSPFRMIASPKLQAVRSFGSSAHDPFFPTYALPSPGRRLLVASSRHAYVDPVKPLTTVPDNNTSAGSPVLAAEQSPSSGARFRSSSSLS